MAILFAGSYKKDLECFKAFGVANHFNEFNSRRDFKEKIKQNNLLEKLVVHIWLEQIHKIFNRKSVNKYFRTGWKF